MNQIPIRLGPLALLLTIISICLTTLSILTFTTSGADLRLAEKYADTVRVRYELEAEGQAFLEEAENAAAAGLPLDAVADAEAAPGGGIRKRFEKDGTILTVQLAAGADGVLLPDATGMAEAGGRVEPVEADDPDGELLPDSAKTGDSYRMKETAAAGSQRRVRILEWKIARQWEEDDSIGNIWMPE